MVEAAVHLLLVAGRGQNRVVEGEAHHFLGLAVVAVQTECACLRMVAGQRSV